MFPILYAFDSVFRFARLSSYAPQLQKANEELCLCTTSLSHSRVPPSFSKLTYCALQETLNLCSTICSEVIVSVCASSQLRL